MTENTFAAFPLAAPLQAALAANGFTEPTPIQAQAIGPQLDGRDILGLAQTGTGKTAAFGLPLLHRVLELRGRPASKTCRALVLAPTRELAVQIEAEFRRFAGGARLSTALVLGGVSRGMQIRRLARGIDVVIATPGRLSDLVGEGHLRLDETRFVVLDEADRMLDMGFIHEVRRLVEALHPRRQSALFSATMPQEVAHLAESFLSDPVRVSVTPENETAGTVEERVEVLPTPEKRARLAALVSDAEVEQALVFARTKRGADRVAQNLSKDGIEAEALHGNKSQNARQRALQAFRSGRLRVLVATDIAARGIDVQGISHVINYDLPDEAASYVHRIGRTGRNGATGTAVTLCAPEERDKLRAVERLTRQNLAPEGALRGGAAPGPKKPGPKKTPAPVRAGEGAAKPDRARQRRRRRPGRQAA
ncbi:MAG: DEAD/DEAH box helicase [Pseudomonadota bacterium]